MSPTVTFPGEQSTLLSSVSWATYNAHVDESRSTGNRLTNDRGDLEIMSPGSPHETAKRLLARMIDQFTMFHDIEIGSAGSTTFRWADSERGFEADESYYVQNVAAIRGKDRLDLTVVPPPDLVIEIEMSRSAIKQLGLFVAFGVPDVWCYDNSRLRIHRLGQKVYVQTQTSVSLPGFPVEIVESVLSRWASDNETELIREFARFCQGG